MDDLAARTMAKELGIGKALFKDVPVGGRFRFHTGPVYVRMARGYREEGGYVMFRTGRKTAVFRLD